MATQEIQAHFKRFEKHYHSKRHGGVQFNPVFSFEYNGKKYTTVESLESSTEAEKRIFKNEGKSATYTIWINPENPYHCYHRCISHWVNFVFVLAIIFLILLGGIVIWKILVLTGRNI